ncbi:lysophospholipid acyltransferase family protein [Cedecea colo]|uniref:L-ornithine N(alpha)-acyltransferase n=1 Tax=Cedecea colo TaxID=2552946 RepID=A0ABX0VIT4_9ENTR|nr:lysophospholipid acyltransferase family protein [Cedecea colo]NIY46151.1 GNAT family N-acetyltransferase [Cedecea colo]
MDTLNRIVTEFFPDKSFSPLQLWLVKLAFGKPKFLAILQEEVEKSGLDWVQHLVETLRLKFEVQRDDYDNIPQKGPAIVISNHPTIMDGAALVNTVSKVRKDIKIVANHVLPMIFPAVKDITIGIKNMAGKMSHRQFAEMNTHLKNGGVLIICPAGKLATISLTGLQEQPWNVGFVQLALRNNAALIPVHIKGRNSARYYLTAALWRKLSNLMIIREGKRHQGKTLGVKIGEQIKLPSASSSKELYPQFAERCQRHLLLTGKNEPGILPTLPAVARPENKRELINAVKLCEVLKTFRDGKVILVYRYQGEALSPIINELGRLRELCFREYGAGSGKKRDNDGYDLYYYHIILWQPQDGEIVGAYRVMPAGESITSGERSSETINGAGIKGLYSNRLFTYHDNALPYLEKSLEIGRGFVQSHHQKTNALDCLWRGIFCFTKLRPEYTYFLGVLTIPNSCTDAAQRLIVNFYQLYFSTDEQICMPVNPYSMENTALCHVFSGDNFFLDWERLKEGLKAQGCTLPWPYKQAAKWYRPGGSKILSFAKDDSFNSIVGLNLCEINSLKEMYFKHYYELKDSECR